MTQPKIYTLIASAVLAASIPEQAFAQCVTTESSTATVSIASASAPAPGNDLVLSFDGSTAVLADERDNEIAVAAGAVHVFVRQGDQWVFQQKLVPFDGVFGDQFGISAALSASGDTLIVGQWLDDDLGTNAGTASVFVRHDGSWSLQQKFTAPDATAGDFFGVSVALAADGDLAVIGAHGDNGAGSAYVFVRTGSTWGMQAKLSSAQLDQDDRFGLSVDTSADGATALVGAHGDDDIGSASGAAYVFERQGKVWSLQDKLTGAAIGAGLGFSVALAGDGQTAVLGAPGEQHSINNFGSVYLFARPDGSWVQQADFMDPLAGIETPFGLSVDITTDGNTAIAGVSEQPGVGRVFTRQASEWQLSTTLLASNPDEINGLANRVAISPDGQVALVQASEPSAAGGNMLGYFYSPVICTVAAADLDADGDVDIIDFLTLLASWGPCAVPCPPSCVADIDNDCAVGISDLLLLLATWG